MTSNKHSLESLLAKFMFWGVILPALILLSGGAYYLYRHGHDPVRDQVFVSEPSNLRHPMAILESVFSGSDLSVLQFGVLLLLLNPLFRIALALAGFFREKNPLYIAVCILLLGILSYSLFGG